MEKKTFVMELEFNKDQLKDGNLMDAVFKDRNRGMEFMQKKLTTFCAKTLFEKMTRAEAMISCIEEGVFDGQDILFLITTGADAIVKMVSCAVVDSLVDTEPNA